MRTKTKDKRKIRNAGFGFVDWEDERSGWDAVWRAVEWSGKVEIEGVSTNLLRDESVGQSRGVLTDGFRLNLFGLGRAEDFNDRCSSSSSPPSLPSQPTDLPSFYSSSRDQARYT